MGLYTFRSLIWENSFIRATLAAHLGGPSMFPDSSLGAHLRHDKVECKPAIILHAAKLEHLVLRRSEGNRTCCCEASQ